MVAIYSAINLKGEEDVYTENDHSMIVNMPTATWWQYIQLLI